MAFLKTLINRIIPPAPGDDTPLSGDHYLQLEYLRREHEWIQVSASKNERIYQSLILHIDPNNKELVVDELFPAEGVDLLQPGDTLEINSVTRQHPISFFTRLLAREQWDDDTVYRLELPEEIGRNQSRGAYRVYVESEVGLDIEVTFDGEVLPAVRIINLSADGIKLAFAEDMDQHFGQQRHFADCLIRLPDGTDVDCDIELRNLYTIRSPHLHSLGGGKLVIKHPQQRVKLQQFLAAVQRRQRRMENREDSL